MTPLDELLDTLDQVTEAEDAPMLVAAFGDPGTDRVLTTDNDLSHLIGWRLPDHCWAAGVVSAGTGRHTDHGPAPAAGLPARVVSVCLVDRTGTVASRVRTPDGTVLASGQAQGRLIDALRRSLDLPTPPAEGGTEEFLAVLWLGAVRQSLEEGGGGSWPEVAALHPAMGRLEEEDAHADLLDDFDMVARLAALAWNWEHLRLRAAEDRALADLVPPGSAGWMDAGMFARWVMGSLPDLHLLRGAVQGRLPADTRRRIDEALAATGVNLAAADKWLRPSGAG